MVQASQRGFIVNRLADLVWVWRKLADEVLRDPGLRIGYRRCADELARVLASESAQVVRDVTTIREGVILSALLRSLHATVRRVLAAPTARHAHTQLERLARNVGDLIESFDALDTSERVEVEAAWTDLDSLGGVAETTTPAALVSRGRRVSDTYSGPGASSLAPLGARRRERP